MKKVVVRLPNNDYLFFGKVVACSPWVLRKYYIKNGDVCIKHRGHYIPIIEKNNQNGVYVCT